MIYTWPMFHSHIRLLKGSCLWNVFLKVYWICLSIAVSSSKEGLPLQLHVSCTRNGTHDTRKSKGHDEGRGASANKFRKVHGCSWNLKGQQGIFGSRFRHGELVVDPKVKGRQVVHCDPSPQELQDSEKKHCCSSTCVWYVSWIIHHGINNPCIV